MFRLQKLGKLLNFLLLAVPLLAVAETQRAGSYAEVWLSQTNKEKTAFLDGLCHGVQAAQHAAGEMGCPPAQQVFGQGRGWQFCATRDGFVPDGTKASATGVEILDAFYAKRSNLRIPRKLDTCSAANWTVVPAQTGHLFHAKLDTLGVTARGRGSGFTPDGPNLSI